MDTTYACDALQLWTYVRTYVRNYFVVYVRSCFFTLCLCLLLCRSEAQDRITAMKEQLKSSAHSASLFEEGKHDAEMRLKDAETRRDAFKKQVSTARTRALCVKGLVM